MKNRLQFTSAKRAVTIPSSNYTRDLPGNSSPAGNERNTHDVDKTNSSLKLRIEQ